MLAATVIVGIFVVIMTIKHAWRFVTKHGIEIIIIRAMIGNHTAGHRHTNATFWRKSDGKVYGSPATRVLKRHHRAGWINLVRSLAWIGGITGLGYGLLTARTLTIVLASVAAFSGIALWITVITLKARRWFRNRHVVAPLSAALSSIPEMPDDQMEKSIILKPDYLKITRGELGRINFPDRFHANDGQKEAVNKLVTARFPIPVAVEWHERAHPIYAAIVAAPPLLNKIYFRDKLADIEACGMGEYIAGYDNFGDPYIVSHMGDSPHHAYSMGSGAGKSVRLRTYAAQLLGKDNTTQLTGFDTKRVSLACLRGIPGVTLYTDPKHMEDMWNGWYLLKEEMDRRYVEYEKDPASVESFPYHYIVLEEGNDFSVQIKGFYMHELREKGGENHPPIWYEAIAPLLWQGREVRMFVIAVLQDFKERFFGNMSLRTSFGTVGMAKFKPGQWRTIIGTTPVPELQTGQGRLCIVEGQSEKWIQGLYDDETYLREYAMRYRKPSILANGPVEIPAQRKGDESVLS